MANPEQQGLKLMRRKGISRSVLKALMANPEQQGLKQKIIDEGSESITQALMANPEQQGLKLLSILLPLFCLSMP